IKLHSDNFILITKIHSTYSHGCSSCRPDICFVETNTLSVFCYKQNVLRIVCRLNLDQFVVLSECDGCQPCLSDICVVHDRSLLDKTLLCCHEQILSFFILLDRDDCGDLLLRLKLKQIDDRRSSCGPSRLRNFISFQTVDPSRIGEEHNIVMG